VSITFCRAVVISSHAVTYWAWSRWRQKGRPRGGERGPRIHNICAERLVSARDSNKPCAVDARSG